MKGNKNGKSIKSQMKVYCRIKPNQQNKEAVPYKINHEGQQLQLLPKLKGMISNKDILDYNFTHVLNQDIQQEQVFSTVAKPVVDSCMQGFNGTIFAYGQTGSGKTYTMNGSETWQDRGIIPRTISYIYDQIEERQNTVDFNIYISFMEIYNENAYDLLDHRHLDSPLESWNKINLMEDDFGNIHLKNISVHSCNEEQQCIDLLMMGSFIRQVSSTPMNQSSSRSHAVFTITFEGKHIDSEMQFISKLHLVDLAGSERIQKSNIDGQLVNEAKYINLSLTYLEQVILALNEKQKNSGKRTHIPYRNSLMTTILKDSLGGNCQTVMIATASSEISNYDETISTLRFSQRVGQLENEIRKNEKVNLEQYVNKLEKEKDGLIQQLEYYQNMFKGIQQGDSNGLNLNDIQNNRPQLKEIENILQNSSRPLQYQQGQQQQQQNIIIDGKQVFYTSNQFNDENNIKDFRNVNDETKKQLQKQVENFLSEKEQDIQIQNIQESKLCFHIMKNIYNIRMKEYVTELTFISEKLQSYDELLSQKKKNKHAQKGISSKTTTQTEDELNSQLNTEQDANNENIINGNNQKQQQQQSTQNQENLQHKSLFNQYTQDNMKYMEALKQLQQKPGSSDQFAKKSEVLQQNQQNEQQQQIQGKFVPMNGKYKYIYQPE